MESNDGLSALLSHAASIIPSDEVLCLQLVKAPPRPLDLLLAEIVHRARPSRYLLPSILFGTRLQALLDLLRHQIG